MTLIGRHEVGDVDAMLAFGRSLAAELRAGDLVLLHGPLGAGKTTLTRGLGEGLQVRGAVTSPTFVIARIHPGPLPLVHVDAYRLESVSELDDLDLDADLDESVTVVEWGEGKAEALAGSRLDVVIERPTGDSGDGEVRIVSVTGTGPRWESAALDGSA